MFHRERQQRSRRATPDESRSALVPLLLPRVAAVVIAELLPEAGSVTIDETEAAHPLRALPEVEVWDEQSRRAAVFRRQRSAVVTERDPGLAVRDVGGRQ